MKRVLCFIVGVLLMCCHSVSMAQKKSPKELRSGVLQFLDSTVVKNDSIRVFRFRGHTDISDIKMRMKNIAQKNKENLSRQLQDRVLSISDTLLQHIWPNSKKPRAYELNDAERQIFIDAIELLPPSHQEILEKHLTAFYFVENFRRSGWLRYDSQYKRKRLNHMILSPRLFTQSVSDYLNYKEKMVFEDTDSLLYVQVEASQEQNALWLVLMHEAAHVLDEHNGISAFTKNIWQTKNVPKLIYDFDYRDQIHFYKGDKIPEDQMLQMYHGFSKTPFPSLYASLSWGEDFAEFAALYYMTQIKKLPYRIVIKRGDEELFSYAPMENPIVLERYKGIQRLLRFD